ncbi:MAG: class I tRNA ligase family protein, partial [Candidatus Bathyarchaeota archaeon]
EVGYEGAYQEVEDPSLHFKMKARDADNEYFLVWTTMPFTLVTDLMLAVHPEAEYAKVKVGDETWILVKDRVDPVMRELGIANYRIISVVSAKELEGVKYEFPFRDIVPEQRELDEQPRIHTVVCEDFVDVSTATGVVHLSPGNGEEDFQAAQKRQVSIYVPFDDECRFTEAAGEFAGMFARDADSKVVDLLRQKNLLVSVKMVQHEYPTCWRSHHKLIWLARKEYFLWTNKVNTKVVKAAEKVKYFFESPKNRFLAFLREGKPWCISRERVWGAPLPVWVCQKCGHKIVIGSKKELLERNEKPVEASFELHTPWVDRVVLRCSKCSAVMKREPFVLDAWHNSGASPYARFTDTEFKKYVPVDFLTEGIDQTRGWANSLLLEYVILTGKAEAPYKAFLFQGLAQDEKGRKMSKSLGNVLEANVVLETNSADVCRYYMLGKCSPVDTIDFDLKEMNKRTYQILGTLYHLHRFFMQNAEYDRFNPQEHTLQWAEKQDALEKPDYWLLSRIQRTIKEVTQKLETSEFHFALSGLEEFVVDVISRQYIPMIRRELWSDDPSALNRRLAVYATLWSTLKTLVLLFNPATPFMSEFMHQHVYKELDSELPQSVNLMDWPAPDEHLQDTRLEQEFETLFQCVRLAYSARQAAKLKRRWPLKKARVITSKQEQKAMKSLEKLFLELANVKEVEYLDALSEVDSKRWVQASEDNLQVLLDTKRDSSLLGAGVMRDIARRVQALRRELGFKPTDILAAVHVAELDAKNLALLKPYLTDMAELVRTKKASAHETRDAVKVEWHKSAFEGRTIYIAIEK